jgi:hypothetical protein
MSKKTLLNALSLVVFGVVMAAGLIAVVLRLFPNLTPGGTRFIFTQLDGDTFRFQPGQVRPPAENTILEDVVRFDDADGFRMPANPSSTYRIAAIGDSFTDGGPKPWPDVLAERLGVPVRNLGYSGFGPLEYAEVAKKYLAPNHDWVIVAYFEGNDLSNIETSRRKADEGDGTIQLNIQRTLRAPIIDVKTLEEYGDITLAADGNYLYPLAHNLPNRRTAELAYISDYLWWLNGTSDIYTNSRNLRELSEALASIRDSAGSACVALMYVPVKGHIYFPYADPAGNRQYVLQNARSLSIDPATGWLTMSGLTPQDYAVWEGHMDNQRDAVRLAAENAGFAFIDLLPTFRAAADNAQITYYTYDSHWNQDGHTLAGEAVADYIENTPCLTALSR